MSIHHRVLSCLAICLITGSAQAFAVDPAQEQGTRVVAVTHKGWHMRYETPHPDYPLQARIQHIRGRGTIRVSFGNDGKPTGAAMVQSTHSPILDSNATRYAYKNWRSTPGNPSTLEVHLVYALDGRVEP